MSCRAVSDSEGRLQSQAHEDKTLTPPNIQVQSSTNLFCLIWTHLQWSGKSLKILSGNKKILYYLYKSLKLVTKITTKRNFVGHILNQWNSVSG